MTRSANCLADSSQASDDLSITEVPYTLLYFYCQDIVDSFRVFFRFTSDLLETKLRTYRISHFLSNSFPIDPYFVVRNAFITC